MCEMIICCRCPSQSCMESVQSLWAGRKMPSLPCPATACTSSSESRLLMWVCDFQHFNYTLYYHSCSTCLSIWSWINRSLGLKPDQTKLSSFSISGIFSNCLLLIYLIFRSSSDIHILMCPIYDDLSHTAQLFFCMVACFRHRIKILKR